MEPCPDDFVKALFDALPDVKKFDEASLASVGGGCPINGNRLRPPVVAFINRCQLSRAGSKGFVDADCTYIFEKATRMIDHSYAFDATFLTMLSDLALSDGRRLSDSAGSSRKTQYMRYAIWVARGRRDAEDPFDPISAQLKPIQPLQAHDQDRQEQATELHALRQARCHPANPLQALPGRRAVSLRLRLILR